VPFDGVSFDGVTIPEHRDTVYNGKFDAGKIGWTLNVWGGSATGDVINGEYRTIISSLGNNNYDIQLVQSGLILQQGKNYQVSFDAYAASERILEVNVEMEKDPWTSYLEELETFNLTTVKKTCSFTFKMEHPTDSSGRLGFNFGASTGTVYLDNISIQQATENMVASGNRRIRLKPGVSYANGSLGIKYSPVPGTRLSVELFDLKGNVVKSGNLQSVSDNTWTYDLSLVPSGIYVAGIRAEGKIISSTRFLHRN